MKVVHLSCVAPPEVGGIGKLALREVVGLRARGVDARLIAPEPREPSSSTGERSFIERLKPMFRIGNASILPQIVEHVRDADVIHLHYPFYGTAEPLLFHARELPPIVVTFHMDATASRLTGVGFFLHRLFLQSWLVNRAARVLVSSFDYARHSSLRSWFLSHPDRVLELPFGVDTDFFCPGPAARHRFSVPSDAPTIAFVGGMDKAHAFKGVPELLRSFSHVNASAHLLLVGDGDLRASFEDRARSLGVSSRVHFLGRADDETLRDVFRSADVFAFPSTNAAEAFGLAALEAEACGIPVVASSLPGVRTVVIHGETGLLVPPKDVDALTSALTTLLADETLRRTMSVRARMLAVERFAWEKHLDGLERVYRDVCVLRS